MKFIAQVLAYEEGECISRAVEPWTSVCERIDIFESAFQTMVNLGYPLRSTDGTIEKCELLAKNHSNVRFSSHQEINEPVLRNRHLWETCRDFGRDDTVLFILDADEIYSAAEVTKCIAQVTEEYDRFNTFWISMSNYVAIDTYYSGFRVPRFFRLKGARGFSGYNDICFQEGIMQTDIRDVLPKHMSWCPVEKARRKIEWQASALNWVCSFAVKDDKVVLNNDYYRQTNKERPIFIKDLN